VRCTKCKVCHKLTFTDRSPLQERCAGQQGGVGAAGAGGVGGARHPEDPADLPLEQGAALALFMRCCAAEVLPHYALRYVALALPQFALALALPQPAHSERSALDDEHPPQQNPEPCRCRRWRTSWRRWTLLGGSWSSRGTRWAPAPPPWSRCTPTTTSPGAALRCSPLLGCVPCSGVLQPEDTYCSVTSSSISLVVNR
jgi:hypothetical protein